MIFAHFRLRAEFETRSFFDYFLALVDNYAEPLLKTSLWPEKYLGGVSFKGNRDTAVWEK